MKNLNLNNFYQSYINSLKHSLDKVDMKKLSLIVDIFITTFKKKKQIFVCGNGGSAAISNHYICDYLKLLRFNTNFKPKILSLVNNVETLTAISNDHDYSEIFKYQAESLANKGDIFIIISSSGNSENVVKLAKWANINNNKVISFTGFKGGRLKKLSHININIEENNYGRVEDSHHILMHLIMHYIILNSKHIKKPRL
jgi:D-sedoheptulose 7-phosphate isomerase